MVIGSFLENGIEATLSSKLNVPSISKGHFSVFWKFLHDEVETVFWESEEKHQKLFKSKFGIGSFLENGFEGSLSSRTDIVGVWELHFLVFCKFLIDEVKTIFWESEAKCWNLFKSKFGQGNLLRNWFWSYLELKNEFSERLKRAFFSFLQIFEWRSWNRFPRKARRCCENFLDKVCFVWSFLENDFQSLFDHSRQSFSELLNISNVLNASISIFSWS